MTQGSLFDGAGGMRIGFEQVGFETSWRVDLLNGNDIKKVSPSEFSKVDLISGGPPCQRGSSLSSFAKNRTKITLWKEMLQFITALRPRWVVVENVLGFLPEMVTEWTPQLQQLGYGCAGQCISSRHWVPQLRTRAFIVARMEVFGVALWNHLYLNNFRGKVGANGHSSGKQSGKFFCSCSDCLRNGVSPRVPAWEFACLGAGNAVTVPLARFLAERILTVEALIVSGKFVNKDVNRLF